MRPEVKALLGKVPGGEFWEAIERPEQNEDRGKGIAWKGGNSMATFLYVSFLLFYSYLLNLLGSGMGALWSQGLEGISVSIGCEIRKLWKE